jgi:hypothetical protein
MLSDVENFLSCHMSKQWPWRREYGLQDDLVYASRQLQALGENEAVPPKRRADSSKEGKEATHIMS